MTDVQLSAGTFIDNDVLNFSEHQIKFLQDTASLPSFGGIVEPDLNKSRKRGPFVLTFFQGDHKRQMLVGLYRTMGFPQDKQLMRLRPQEETKTVLQCLNSFTFKENNDLDAQLDQVIAQVQQLKEERRHGAAFTLSYKTAARLLVLGNSHFARSIQEKTDEELNSAD